jgi:uncharacterized membrane protein YqiK
MSMPSQASQKMKPLFILIAVLVVAIVVISQAPGFVQYMSSAGN